MRANCSAANLAVVPQLANILLVVASSTPPPLRVAAISLHHRNKSPMRTFALFVVTALAEIIGCYLPWLWLKQGASVWLLLPAAASLTLFAWLLTLHPDASGRIYAAYGGVYVSVALLWLWAVDGVRPTLWDAAGVALCLAGMLVIMLAPRG